MNLNLFFFPSFCNKNLLMFFLPNTPVITHVAALKGKLFLAAVSGGFTKRECDLLSQASQRSVAVAANKGTVI